MCYKRPGPRCPSYALGQVKTAVKEMAVAERSEDFDAWEKSMAKRDDAEFQYYMTQAGQEALQRRIDKGKDVAKNTELKTRAAQAREASLLSIGIAPKDSKKDVAFSHHDGSRDESAPRSISFDPDSVTVNESDFPHPQANRLDKVSTTVDAVNGGASTASGIAQTLDVVDRQGYYYADAAGYLGFVEEVRNGDFKEYTLTSLGQQFAESDAAGREEMIRNQVKGMPLMQVYQEEGADAAREFMQSTQDSGDSTVERRITTLDSWSKALGRSSLTHEISRDRQQGQARVTGAAEYVAGQRKKRQAQPATVQAPVCSTCFTQMSLTGVCANCDD